jgi:hypothetical protein
VEPYPCGDDRNQVNLANDHTYWNQSTSLWSQITKLKNSSIVAIVAATWAKTLLAVNYQ